MKNSEQNFVFSDISEILEKTEAEKKEFDARCMLIDHIGDFIKDSKMSQTQIAKIIGVDQPRVSDIVRGRVSKFSLGTLISFLWMLNFDITIKVKAPQLRTTDKLIKKNQKNIELIEI